MKKIVMSILYFGLFSIVPFFQCTNNVAGGTADTGNSKIAAVIYSQNGGRVGGASVILTPANYLSETGADSSIIRKQQIQETVTDRNGNFTFDSVPEGSFTIEVNDGSANAVLMKVTVALKDTQQFRDTLRPYAIISGNAGSISDSSIKRYLLIYGLDRKIPVNGEGAFTISNLPAGTFHLKIVSELDTVSSLEIDTVNAISAQTLTITSDQWQNTALITFNTTSSGAAVTTDVYNFPVLIRLTTDNFVFSQAKGDGNDCRFIKLDGTSLPYSIESWDSTQSKASIWLIMDTIHGNAIDSIRMHWGNTSAQSSISTANVFDSADGFMATYHFNGNVNNASSSLYNGTDSGTTDLSDGIIGNARDFNGSSFISAGILPDRPAGSISFWFRPQSTFDTSVILPQGIWGKKVDNNNDYTISLRGKMFYTDSVSIPVSLAGSSGHLLTKLENYDTSTANYLYSSTKAFLSGTWYHVYWCWGSGNNALYINGTLECSQKNITSLTVSGNANDEIGRSFYDSANIATGLAYYFTGALDEFRIEQTSRSASWVKLCFANQQETDLLVNLRR